MTAAGFPVSIQHLPQSTVLLYLHILEMSTRPRLPLFVARTAHPLLRRFFVIPVGAGRNLRVEVEKLDGPMASGWTFFELISRYFECEGLGTPPPPPDEGLLMRLCEAFSVANELFGGKRGKER
jgi:hypothetical protein